VRVRPRPRYRAPGVLHFRGDFARAVDAVRAIAQAGLYPTNCRLLSTAEAALNFVTDDGRHVLVLGVRVGGCRARTRWRHARRPLRGARRDVPARVRGARRARRATDGAAGAWRAAFIEAPYLQSSALVSLGRRRRHLRDGVHVGSRFERSTRP
jgi:alkyldihydroxyacetonephosphate synthase